jgi:hypothetical protein
MNLVRALLELVAVLAAGDHRGEVERDQSGALAPLTLRQRAGLLASRKMRDRPIVLLHGYSAKAASLSRWRGILEDRGYQTRDIRVGEYISLSNEVTIKDIAEGFDRALRFDTGLPDDQEFDAIVHSTGGLVIREWVTSYAQRRGRLKHLIGLAPAMFGSPMAHRGRGALGAIFKGDKNPLGPDFMEAGDRILEALELGSSYTWELAHRDLLTPEELDGHVISGSEGRQPHGEARVAEPVYGDSDTTPYPFIFIGRDRYKLEGLFVHEDGYDGTVRWAGAGLNARKLIIDLTRLPAPEARVAAPARRSVPVPLVLIEGRNHATILSDPPEDLVSMVMEALEVSSMDQYLSWAEKYTSLGEKGPRDEQRWQQFVVRVVDERGDPVPDWYLEVGAMEGDAFEPLRSFGFDVHPFTGDTSYRAFHADLTELAEQQQGRALKLRLTAPSGTQLVAYHGFGSQTYTPEGSEREDENAVWDAQIDLTPHLPEGTRLFRPYTTTLVEIRLNREPLPPQGPTKLAHFVDLDAT